MLVISIDGACRRNGQPNCIAAGGAFVLNYHSPIGCLSSTVLSEYEVHSTNQRGEMLALLASLKYVYEHKMSTQIITDSEYLFNTMTKAWIVNWANKGWITATEEPVKNKDLWQQIKQVYDNCLAADIEVLFYHIKGHVIPFGKCTAEQLLHIDPTGLVLYNAVKKKYKEVKDEKKVISKVSELSMKNNGFVPTEAIMELFVVTNIVADSIATQVVERADNLAN